MNGPCTSDAGALNHRPGNPATCIPIRSPLAQRRVTSVQPVSPSALDNINWQAGIHRFKK
jgi:hypothetical protein